MPRPDYSTAHIYFRRIDRVYAQLVYSNCCADYIDDRIYVAQLMKNYVFSSCLAVDLGLGSGDRVKYRLCGLFNPALKRTSFYKRDYLF